MKGRDDTNVMIIDPTDMTDDEAIILNYAMDDLATKKNINYYDIDFLLPVPHDLIKKRTDIDIDGFNHIKLKHSIVRRLRDNISNQHRYEVYGDFIGGGGFGKVFKSIGTLVPLET